MELLAVDIRRQIEDTSVSDKDMFQTMKNYLDLTLQGRKRSPEENQDFLDNAESLRILLEQRRPKVGKWIFRALARQYPWGWLPPTLARFCLQTFSMPWWKLSDFVSDKYHQIKGKHLVTEGQLEHMIAFTQIVSDDQVYAAAFDYFIDRQNSLGQRVAPSEHDLEVRERLGEIMQHARPQLHDRISKQAKRGRES